jgi:hypothetical protein
LPLNNAVGVGIACRHVRLLNKNGVPMETPLEVFNFLLP